MKRQNAGKRDVITLSTLMKGKVDKKWRQKDKTGVSHGLRAGVANTEAQRRKIDSTLTLRRSRI